MPINKDLSVSPYFDDFDAEKNFYKVLFKPGTAVQVRELNQLQTVLQNQIEKFGNNIYKRGTIIDGVNFVYHSNYAYVKINDSQLDGVPAAINLYVGNFVVDPTTNLTAYVINSADGYESTNPDLKTLYLRYINSGNSGLETKFAPGTTLTVYDYLDSINNVIIGNGSSGFANNDSVVFCSAIAVDIKSNANFTVGETIVQNGNSHFAIIDSIETIKDKKVLKIRPRSTDLSNTEISSDTWEFTVGQDIIGSVSGAVATVNESIGNGAKASLITTADIGKIVDINITARGSRYWVPPYVTIKSSGVASALGSRNYSDLNLIGRNYIAQIKVSTNNDSVGYGYAFGVTEGVIYQKGYFLSVNPQTVIVDKYSNVPDNVAIGFDSIENIIDSNSDSSLLDNSTGSPNEFAPGADRLNIEPKLVVISSDEAAANNEFFSIVEFSNGSAFRENKRTQFNSIMDEMAIRTNEQSGNFVLDKFLVTTSSTANQAYEGKQFAVITDPGRGYINGYRVETKSNFVKNVDKGIDSRTASNLSASINYGDYILVNEAAGVFNFTAGNIIQLHDTALQRISNTALVSSGSINAPGTQIGFAHIRNVVYDSGSVGTPQAVYRMYLFNINMYAGHRFDEVRAVYYNGSNKGVADVVLTYDATTGANVCQLQDTSTGTSLLIDSGSDSTNNLTNLNYVYRMVNESVEMTPNGNTSALLTDPSEVFAYTSSALTDAERNSLTLVPINKDIILQINATANGTANVSASSNVVSLSMASTANKYEIGDFVAIYSAANNYVVRRVTGKQSSALEIDQTAGFTGTAVNVSKMYPKGVPVDIGSLQSATALVTGGSKTLTINLGTPIESNTNIICSLSYDVKIANAAPVAKTASRDNFVTINLATHQHGLTGPWCLGIPDIFRLKKVYLDNSSSVNTSSTDVTDQFFIDHNQNEDYYGLGYLYKRNDATIKLTSNTYLLVQFDAFTSSAGVYTINSYVSANNEQRFADDSLTLDQLGTKINSFEIPEVYTSSGNHFDLINCIDFRPYVANTAAYAKTASASSVNPIDVVNFAANNKKFPLPESGVSFDRSYFMGRMDAVVVNTDNRISIVRGVPSDSTSYPEPKVPDNTITLNKIVIPSYPCVPQNFSAETNTILDKKLSNERILLKRIRDKTIATQTSDNDIALAQPKVFTMSDINKLERRVSDLEYTVSLSLIESDLKDKVIPSSINPSINRFKFGFFVDDYTTDKNSDVDNPEYQASVVDSKVVPVTESTLITHGQGYRISDWKTQIALINQDQASEPIPVVVTPPEQTPPPSSTPTPSPAPSSTPSVDPAPPIVIPGPPAPAVPAAPDLPSIVTSKMVSIYRSWRTETRYKFDELRVTMSSEPGTFTIPWNMWGKRDTLAIYKVINGYEQLIYQDDVSGAHTYYGTHDPRSGRDYIIRVIRKSDQWEYTINYPIDEYVFASSSSLPAVNINNLSYHGFASYVDPGFISAQVMNQNFADYQYLSQGTTQNIGVTGLKPSTVHNVFVSTYGSKLITNSIVTVGGNKAINGTIITDEFGTSSFNIQIDTQSLGSVSQLSYDPYSGVTVPASILIIVASPDFNSLATCYIMSKSAQPNIMRPLTPKMTYMFDEGYLQNYVSLI